MSINRIKFEMFYYATLGWVVMMMENLGHMLYG